jgi:hypothetical protein
MKHDTLRLTQESDSLPRRPFTAVNNFTASKITAIAIIIIIIIIIILTTNKGIRLQFSICISCISPPSKYYSYVLVVILVSDSVRVRCGEEGKTWRNAQHD